MTTICAPESPPFDVVITVRLVRDGVAHSDWQEHYRQQGEIIAWLREQRRNGWRLESVSAIETDAKP